MVERLSPLGQAFRPGAYGNLTDGAGVTLSETTPPAILEVAGWPGQEAALAAAIGKAARLSLSAAPKAGAVARSAAAFGIGPGRFLVGGTAALGARLVKAVSSDIGTVTDLSHGRTAIRVAGKRAEWVLSKLFALDFAPAAFPVGEGRASAHHEIFAQIQRVEATAFDIYVFRTFARAFWQDLCAAAEDVGYEVR